MRIFRIIKKNNGSTLAMVLFLLFFLTATALAVLALTGSEVGMSIVTSDRGKALLAAQAGAEQAAQRLDTAVTKIQDDARAKTGDAIRNAIEQIKRGTDIPTLKGVFDVTDPDNIKVLKEEELNAVYANEYKYQFSKLMKEWVNQQTAVNGDWNSATPHSVEHVVTRAGVNVTVNDGSFTYTSTGANDSGILLSTVEATDSQSEIKSVSITANGVYISGNHHTYSRRISAEFNLMTEANGAEAEIPVSYSKLTRVRVNKDAKPDILRDKAVIARKNIISAGGQVTIGGNATCFGTIPKDTATNPPTVSRTADGYQYGGFMAGMTSEVWNNPDFGLNGKSLADSIKTAVGATGSYFSNVSGSFNIIGDAATAGYIHTMYSNSTNQSKINVGGSTFARSFKIERDAHYSEVDLKDVYTTDDLRIDSNNSTVNIGGWGSDNQPTGQEGKLVGLNTGNPDSGYDTSSAVIVSGDSNLNINGSLFIGGTTYFNEYRNAAENKMFYSGISVLKAGSLPAEAFRIWEGEDISMFRYPVNIFYLYNNNNKKDGVLNKDDYIEVPRDSAVSGQQKLLPGEYIYSPKNGHQTSGGSDPADSTQVRMMTGMGIPDPSDPDNVNKYTHTSLFGIIEKAMHFKWIWNTYWKDDIGYSSYLNSGDIRIEPKLTDVNGNEKIKGWCFGAVAANNTVYGPYGDFSVNDGGAQYYENRTQGFNDYVTDMSLFVGNESGLVGVTPGKPLSDNSSRTAGVINTSAVARDTLITSKSGMFLLNSGSDVVLEDGKVRNSTFSGNPTKDDEGYMHGIIYSSGDIYVEAGTKMKGILIAEGNIVFLGGGSEISYDEDTVDILLSERPDAGKLFNYSASDIVLDNSTVKTIKKPNVKNIKIVSWKED
ncbi:MAG TPA: hypothetical protein VHP38_11190 [Ruminiclostridium sp.]|nr:hypothetical protein [Ruminiclostridium sp.]